MRHTPIVDVDLPDSLESVSFGTYHVLKGGKYYSLPDECAVATQWSETDLFSGYTGQGLRLAMDVEPEAPRTIFQTGLFLGGSHMVANVELGKIGYDAQEQNLLFPYIDDDGNEAYQGINIKDVSFIGRNPSKLSTLTGDDLERYINDRVFYSDDTPEDIARALSENESVAEAYTEDGQNVVVRMVGDSCVTIYPAKTLGDAFYEEASGQGGGTGDEEGMARRRTQKLQSYPTMGENGQVAVFNYFSDDLSREGQNKILEGMIDELVSHGYGIDYRPKKEFTMSTVQDVVLHSQQAVYDLKAIIIMSEGAIVTKGSANRSFFATGEQVSTGSADSFKDSMGRSVLAMQVQSLKGVSRNCLLYVGSCFAFDDESILPNNTYVDWKGQTAIAPAHASLLMHRILNNRWTVSDVMERLWQQDPITGTPLCYQNKKTDASTLPANSNLVPEYEIGLRPTLNHPDGDYAFTKKGIIGNLLYWYDIDGTWAGSTAMPANDVFYVRLVPLMSGKKTYEYKVKNKSNLSFGKSIMFDTEMNGVYDVQLGLHSGFTTLQIRATQVSAFVYSKDFPLNAAETLGEQPDHVISLLYEDNTEVNDIEMNTGDELHLTINESEIYEYKARMRDRGASNTAVTVSGNSLTVKAGNECRTKLIVWRTDNEAITAEYDLTVKSNGTSPTNINVSRSYEYDALNRLVKVVTPTYTTTYTYDALGNRTIKMVTTQGVEGVD